jgi:cell division protein FtsI/penicillin-binding protein 2
MVSVAGVFFLPTTHNTVALDSSLAVEPQRPSHAQYSRGALAHKELGLQQLLITPAAQQPALFSNILTSHFGLTFDDPARSLRERMVPLQGFGGGATGSPFLALEAPGGVRVTLTLEQALQNRAESLLKGVQASVASIILIEVSTGRILAFADRSSILRDPLLHAEYPAASLFKIVSSAAAIDLMDANAETPLRFRGGTYTLNQYNYVPDGRRDTRLMTLGEALAKSCNPAFARLVYDDIDASELAAYASAFGFNLPLGFDLPLSPSSALVPEDLYGLTRTAAGFGEVFLSPVHAALVGAMLGNKGVMPRPTLIDGVESEHGEILYDFTPAFVDGVGLSESSAKMMLEMLEKTTTIGTSRSEFSRRGKPILGDVRVAGKTGTLRGENPEGIHNWFIGVAPIQNPQVAIATLVVHPDHINTRASRLAREMLVEYFENAS